MRISDWSSDVCSSDLPGEPLPSTRLLAKSLGIARGTVIEAFEQLLAEGVLESRPGAGTRISRSLHDPANSERPIRSPATAAKPMPPPSPAAAFAKVAEEFAPMPQAPFAVSDPAGPALPADRAAEAPGREAVGSTGRTRGG